MRGPLSSFFNQDLSFPPALFSTGFTASTGAVTTLMVLLSYPG
jgi:hypothetical protein